jgi:sec-independent protein translocase protein TatA
MPNIGPLEIIIVLVIVLIIFGPKRLPDLGRSMGRGMREFKDSVTGKSKDNDELEEGSSENVTRSESKQPAAAGDRSSG